MRIRWCFSIIAMAACTAMWGQNKVSWSAKLEPSDPRPGESGQIVVTAKILPTWHLYSMDPKKGIGPAPTEMSLQPTKGIFSDGKPVQPLPVVAYDPNFGINIGSFEKEVRFGVPVRFAPDIKGKQEAVVYVRYMACNPRTCTPIMEERIKLTIQVAQGPVRPEYSKPITTIPAQPISTVSSEPQIISPIRNAEQRGLIAFLLFCFVGGLAALLTPCVFPMVPITVSYFSKSTEKSNLGGAIAYCLGIMGTFTGLGLILAVFIGATGVRNLANSPILNFALAIFFVVLALNLFGVYQVRPPSWLLNRVSGGSRRAGFVGPVMMGLTFSLTSFTCTLPVVGALLAAAASGSYMYPFLGMLAFSIAFAAPFFLLALFPQALAKMPKSGSWMVSVKVFLGFVELLAAVKFLSNVDLVYQMAIITQPVFLAVWASICAIAGLYLLGWLRLPHDPMQVQIGTIRRGFGALSIAAGIWFLSGINGRSLGEINGLLPPDPYPGRVAANAPTKWVNDYKSALAVAKAQNKTIFINFTGVNCTNCRAMEKNILSRPEIAAEINKFVPVELWTDRLTAGDRQNQKLQFELAKDVTLPLYAILSSEGKLLRLFSGSTRDAQEFLRFLQGKV